MGESDALANTYNYILDLVLACVCAVLFVILLSLDVWKAFKKRAYWFPGQALVLSAPTIQLLSFVDKLNSSVHSKSSCDRLWDTGVDQLFVNTTRVMICVIIGYLLPGMVNYSFTTMGSNIGALALTVIIHMVSEVYFFMEGNEGESNCGSRSSAVLNSVLFSPSPSPSPSPSSIPDNDYVFEEDTHFWFVELHYLQWLIISWVNLFTVIILLVSLLTCAVLAGKSIRNIISRNVPKALSSCCNSVEGHKQLQCTHSTGDHVLKCWIVVRASQPEDIVSRSVFGSFVGLVVTCCIVFLAVDWIQTEGVDVYDLTPLVFQFVFISVGWIIILFRWLTGVMYFSRDLRSLFKWEDFWTRNIVELKANLNAHYRERLFRQKRLPKTAIQESGIVSSIMAIRLYSLILTMALCLQILMVSLSKVCWCLSEVIFRMVRRILLSPEKNILLSDSDILKTDDSPFFKHKEALEAIKMPGEFAYSLWFANESAFKKVEKHMEEGSEKGSKYSSQLIKLKEHRTGDPPHDDAVVSVEEVENFQEVGKMSWKMKAVSLIRFKIFYYEDAVSTDIDDAMQAYCQAWLLLDIVDASNPEAKLASLAADKEFDALEDIWNKHLKMKSAENPKDSHSFKEHLSKLLEGKMEKRELCQLCEGDFQLFSEEEEAKARKDKNYKESSHQNKEWMKDAAAKLSVYKTRKALDLDTDHSMDKLKRLLANVIFSCIDVEFDRAVIKICNKWAREGNESAIFNAAFVAGIAQGLKIVEGGGGVHLNVDAAVHVPEGSQVSKYPDAINQV